LLITTTKREERIFKPDLLQEVGKSSYGELSWFRVTKMYLRHNGLLIETWAFGADVVPSRLCKIVLSQDDLFSASMSSSL
jgi:hypothetical protein